jgi:hypothetical protein
MAIALGVMRVRVCLSPSVAHLGDGLGCVLPAPKGIVDTALVGALAGGFAACDALVKLIVGSFLVERLSAIRAVDILAGLMIGHGNSLKIG